MEDVKIFKTLQLIYCGTVYSKKNSKRIITNRRTGKPQIVSNPNAKCQERIMAQLFGSQARRAKWVLYDEKAQKGEEFEIEINVFQPDNRKRDLDNQITAILDGLVMARVIPDDSNEYVKRIVATSAIDKTNPHAQIIIRRRLNEITK